MMRIFSISPSTLNNSFRLGVDPLRSQHPNAAFQSKRFRTYDENSLKLVNREKEMGSLKRNVCTHCSSGENLGERIIVGDSDNPEESVKLVCDESGCAVVIGKKVKLEESDIESDYESGLESDEEFGNETNRPYYLICDLKGCSFSPVASSGGIKEIEGVNWSLKYDSAPNSEKSICAQICSNGWSIALSASEYDNFCKLIQDIRDKIIEMSEESILGTETVTIELRKESIQMKSSFPAQKLSQLKKIFQGDNNFNEVTVSTQFILNGEYTAQAQGTWPSEAFYTMVLQHSKSNSVSNQNKVLQEEVV